MNEKLQDILLETLEKAQNAGGEIYNATKTTIVGAVDFAKEQIPDVIAQLMKWEFIYHLVCAIGGLIFIVILFFVLRKLFQVFKRYSKEKNEDGMIGSGVCLAVVFFITVIVFMFGFLNNALTVTKIYAAPKVFLIEYCSDLVQTKQYNATHRVPRESKHNH